VNAKMSNKKLRGLQEVNQNKVFIERIARRKSKQKVSVPLTVH